MDNSFYKLISLKTIKGDNSYITKIIDKNKKNYFGIDEVYSSNLQKNTIKAWKKHKKMTCNILVVKGEIKFVFFDNLFKKNNKIIINEKDNLMLLIKPCVWFGFKGLKKNNTLINFSNILHNDKEILKTKYDETKFKF